MVHGRGDGLHPLIRLLVATAAVGVCFVWLWGEFDRRVEKGFPVGQKPVPVLVPTAGNDAQPAGAVERRVAPTAAPAIEVYFSPNGGATDAIVRELGRAKQRVRVQAYSFTSAPIAKALVEAQRRGVDGPVGRLCLLAHQSSSGPDTSNTAQTGRWSDSSSLLRFISETLLLP